MPAGLGGKVGSGPGSHGPEWVVAGCVPGLVVAPGLFVGVGVAVGSLVLCGSMLSEPPGFMFCRTANMETIIITTIISVNTMYLVFLLKFKALIPRVLFLVSPA